MKSAFSTRPSQLDFFLTPNLNIAFTALVVYDTLITLDREVVHFWKRPKSGRDCFFTLLYFLNRYSAFVSTISSLLLVAFDAPSTQTCKLSVTVASYAIGAGTLASETILSLRTLAIWGRPLWIRILFWVTGLSTMAISTVLLFFSNKALKFAALRGPPHTLGCNIVGASDTFHVIPYFLLAFYDSLIVALTLIKAWQHLLVSASSSKWVKQMYAQGIGFYIIIFAVSLFNALLPFIAPSNFRTALTIPQHVVHSICSTRVVFLLRDQEKSNTKMLTLPTWQFADRTFSNDTELSTVLYK